MFGNTLIEQFNHGPGSSHRPSVTRQAAQMALPKQRHPLAQRPIGKTLVIHCANVDVVSSEVLHRLVVLQRRMRQNNVEVVLKGLTLQARQMFSWTKLDRFFTIQP